MATIETVDPTLADRAEQDADRAARLAGVTVYLIQDHEDVEAVERLLFEVLGGDESLMPPSMTRALIHAGNYVSGAAALGNLIGASVGFLGWREHRHCLHSLVTGVAASMQGRGIGYALKQHQRAWALCNGLKEITWTFDPLVRRNGYFNTTKLGAEIFEYKPNFYGVMRDTLNRDDDSDRCIVVWKLDSQRAAEAAEGRNPEERVDPSYASLLADSGDGRPILTREHGHALTAYVPPDIVRMRRSAPSKAHAWRSALRDAFTWAFLEGYGVTGMTQSGFYIFRRSP